MDENREYGLSNKSLWGFLGRWFWLLALGLLLGAAGSFLLASRLESSSVPNYETEAILLVGSTTSSLGALAGRGFGAFTEQAPILAVKVKLPETLEAAAKEMPPEWKLTPAGLALRITVAGEKPLPGITNPAITVGSGLSMPGLGTPTFSIRVKDHDPVRARGVANALANALIAYVEREQRDSNARTSRMSLALLEAAESSLSSALAERNKASAVLSNTVTPQIAEAEASLSAVKDSVSAQLTEMRTLLAAVKPLAPAETLERVDQVSKDLTTDYAAFQAKFTAMMALLEPITNGVEFQMAYAKAEAIKLGYQAAVRTSAVDLVGLAMLDAPVQFLQEAPEAMAQPFALRKRDATGIGALAGLMLAWIAANAVDSIRAARQSASGTVGGTPSIKAAEGQAS